MANVIPFCRGIRQSAILRRTKEGAYELGTVDRLFPNQ